MAFHHKHNTLHLHLHLLASKLGLGDDHNVLSKAAELERLLQTKSTVGNHHMHETSKVVICLDLAAEFTGAHLDLETAIKYSGLRPAMYTSNKKVIQILLGLNCDQLTTSILCAALHCSRVQELADQILEGYKKQAIIEVDLNLPQYVCMAVYHACRIKKIKVSKSKVMEKSRLKPAQWAKLDADWLKFVNTHFSVAKKKQNLPANNPELSEETEVMDVDTPLKDREPQIEPYEQWKRRMLETAYKELAELQQRERELMQAEQSKQTEPESAPITECSTPRTWPSPSQTEPITECSTPRTWPSPSQTEPITECSTPRTWPSPSQTEPITECSTPRTWPSPSQTEPITECSTPRTWPSPSQTEPITECSTPRTWPSPSQTEPITECSTPRTWPSPSQTEPITECSTPRTWPSPSQTEPITECSTPRTWPSPSQTEPITECSTPRTWPSPSQTEPIRERSTPRTSPSPSPHRFSPYNIPTKIKPETSPFSMEF